MGLGGWREIAALSVIAVSTLLNVAYMLRACLILYHQPDEAASAQEALPRDAAFAAAMVALIGANVALGVLGGPVMELIRRGIALFV